MLAKNATEQRFPRQQVRFQHSYKHDSIQNQKLNPAANPIQTKRKINTAQTTKQEQKNPCPTQKTNN
jgi:hypothetical protein